MDVGRKTANFPSYRFWKIGQWNGGWIVEEVLQSRLRVGAKTVRFLLQVFGTTTTTQWRCVTLAAGADSTTAQARASARAAAPSAAQPWAAATVGPFNTKPKVSHIYK